MINLLPPQQAETIRYGRQNTVLRKWLIGMAASIVGLALIMLSGWFYINSQAETLKKNIDITNQQLQSQNLAKVQADAKEISGDIKVINQVLRSEERFSDLIKTIGSDMPAGTILGGISIGNVSGGLDLTVGGVDHASIAQAAVNLSDPKNQLFSNVDIITVGCNTSTDNNSQPTGPYVCNAEFRALFSNDAKLKFLNVPKADK